MLTSSQFCSFLVSPPKRILFVALIVFLSLVYPGCRNKLIEPPASWRYSWQASIRGTTLTVPNSMGIASDSQGNIYVAGKYESSLRFPSSSNGDDLVDIVENDRRDHCYLAMFRAGRDIEWVCTWGGPEGSADVRSLCVDEAGRILVAGSFVGTVDFDPDSGWLEHSPRHERIGYIAEFDQEGAILQVRVLEIDDPIIAIGRYGTWFVAASFSGERSFQPEFGNEIHGSADTTSTCLLGFNSAGQVSFAASWNATQPVFLDVDSEGCPIVCGSFEGQVDFSGSKEGDRHFTSDREDIYLARFHESGELDWANTWGEVQNYRCSAIAVDREGPIYISGSRLDILEYEATHHINLGDFLVKFDDHGHHVWSRFWEGGGRNASITVNESEKIFITGGFDGTVDFDPDVGIEERTSAYGQWDVDAYLCKYSSDGALLDVCTWGSNSRDKGYDLVVVSGDIYVVSYWNSECYILRFGSGDEW